MAILFFTGFNLLEDGLIASAGGWSVTGGSGYTTWEDGRFGGRSIGLRPYASSSLLRRSKSYEFGDEFSMSVITDYHSNSTAMSSAYTVLISAHRLTTNNLNDQTVCVIGTSNGSLSLRMAGTTLYTTPIGVTSGGRWNHVEVSFKRGDADNGYVKFYINNELLYEFHGATNGTLVPIYLSISGGGYGSGSQSPCRYDSIAVSDGSYIGDFRTDLIVPISDTAEADFTPSTGAEGWAMVDENPSDADTTYISSETVGHRSVFSLTELPPAVASVTAVQVIAAARKTDAGALGGVVTLDSNGAEVSSEVLYPPISYVTGVFPVNLNPDGNVEWTPEAVNAVKIGVEVVA